VIGVVLCAAKGVDGGAKVVSRWPTGLPRPIRHRPGKSTAVVARPGATRRATRLCQRGPQAGHRLGMTLQTLFRAGPA
jgi:hypothetical protein